MFKNLPYKIKFSIISFFVSMLLFSLFILIEDKYVVKQLNIKNIILLKLGRILIAFSFSLIISFLFYFCFNLFHRYINKIVVLLQNWKEEDYNDSEDFYRDDEFGDLIRLIKISIFQNLRDSSEEDLIDLQKKRLEEIKKLHTSIFNINLNIISGIEVSLFPNSSKEPECDYINVIQTEEGCLGIMVGSPKPSLESTICKARAEVLMKFSAKENLPGGKELIINFHEAFKSLISEDLKVTLFHLNKDSGELIYLHSQENPLLLLQDNELVKLEKSNTIFYNSSIKSSEVKSTILNNNSFLILISDQFQKVLRTNSAILFAALEPLFLNSENITTKNITTEILRYVQKSSKETNPIEKCSLIVAKLK